MVSLAADVPTTLMCHVAGERAAVAVQPIVDPMPRLPRLVSPGRPVLEQGLPHLLQAEEGPD